MSIYRLTPDDIEYFTIVANPKRTYESNSLGQITGSIFIFDSISNREKDPRTFSPYSQSFFADNNIINLLDDAKTKAVSGHSNFSQMRQYMSFSNGVVQSSRRTKKALIKRFDPGVVYGKDFVKKTNIKDLFLKQYRIVYPNSHWAYTNYNSLNFFTSSLVPSNSVIIYPNSSSNSTIGTFASGVYCTPSGWTFDFYINPRYQNDFNSPFTAGTIFHLSSTYCVSLISGSLLDSKGNVDGFRIQLQLSHSANISPSLAITGAFPNDLIFRTPDNSLRKNHWHHVAIRWGTNSVNNGTGTFLIDGLEVSSFVIPSSTILPRVFTGFENPNALCVGNYYQGTNSGTSGQSIFFDTNTTANEGLLNLSSLSQNGQPASYLFNHPLNAELHELKIYNRFLSNDEIITNTKFGVEDLDNLVFYVPPFFVKESPKRRNMITPFAETSYLLSTDTPFNVSMSFGVKGHLINLENLTRDFATRLNPRLLNLTASVFSNLPNTTLSANQILYSSASIRKRNLTILPCDNGKFFPNFSILQSGSMNLLPNTSSNHSRFIDDLGVLNLGYISLNNMISTASIIPSLIVESGTMFRNATGVDPESVSGTPTETLAILQRLRDPSSNEISMFNISDLFYGNRINPKTFKITDSSITGSGDKISITVKDDGIGNLYRADAITEHAKWSSVGNIFYNEGVAVIKTPHIPKFGKDQFSMEFEGEQTIHVLKITSEIAANMVNSSSSPNFTPVSASLLANDDDTDFVYITNVYYLDDNFNVLMKANLAQPLKKRSGEKFLLRVQQDW